MNNKSQVIMYNKSIVAKILSWLFVIAVFAVGVINTSRDNGPFFGVCLVLLSFVYFLPVNTTLRKIAGFSIPGMGIVKILLRIFIMWVSFGVGELFNKIELMKRDYNSQSLNKNKQLNHEIYFDCICFICR